MQQEACLEPERGCALALFSSYQDDPKLAAQAARRFGEAARRGVHVIPCNGISLARAEPACELRPHLTQRYRSSPRALALWRVHRTPVNGRVNVSPPCR
jgi:hypothetical protein